MDFVAVNAYNNYIDAHIVLGRLEGDGINCWLKDENTATLTPFWSNAVGGIKLMVADSQATRAVELLTLYKKEQQAQVTCPKCGSNNIEWVSTPRKPGNWFSVLFGLLFINYAMPVEMVYHCFNCKHEFNPPDESSQT